MSKQSYEDERFARTLTWKDGFTLSLVIPVAIFATLGPTIASLGTWTTAALFAIASLVALVQNFMYAEMAAMFPDKPGGIALYAHEAWRRYFAPIGAVAAFGYWAGWAFANSVFALTFGQLIQAQFFPGATWTLSTGTTHIGLAHLIGVVVLVTAWALNVYGIRPTVQLNKLLAIFAVGLIAILGIGPFVTGNFHPSKLTWGLGNAGQAWGGLRLAMVFLFIMGWTAYGSELCATFSPEYRDQRRDTTRALHSAAIFILLVAVLVPIGLGGVLGDAAIAKNPGTIYTSAFSTIIGPAAGLVTILLCASLFLVMNSATADAARALYGIAKDDMTIKELNHLNSRGMPARAMAADLLVNLVLLLLVGNTLGIIFAANIGYFVAVIFALTGYALLRRDRPTWIRPIRLGRAWPAIALIAAAYNAVLLVVAFLNPSDGGYGGTTEQVIGVAVLSASLLLFAFRRIVQDRGPLRVREHDGAAPTGNVATPDETLGEPVVDAMLPSP